MCPLEANVYGIKFVGFKVRGVEEGSEQVLCAMGSEYPLGFGRATVQLLEGSTRWIRYHFGPEFLEHPTIGTTLEFTNGDVPLHNFRLIERHYFRDQLIV